VIIPVSRAPYHARRAGGWRRWWAFNFVGGLGILVQLSVLTALTLWAGMNYLVATPAAVEAAVLHNFLWHEHWTWSDRAVQDRCGWVRRLLRFQLANGALSVGGNLLFMRLFAGMWSVPYPLANAAAIVICSILNFLAGDVWVFKNPGHAKRDTGHPRFDNELY